MIVLVGIQAGCLCIEDGCTNPAEYERLAGMVGDTPLVELICRFHAITEADAP